jgi:transposase-like protein
MNINEFRSMFPDEEICRKYLEQAIWPDGRRCPHCDNQKSWSLSGLSSRKGLYECSSCGKQFTVTTKTPLHSTKLPLRTWLMAMYFMINSSKGVSSVFLAKWIGVRQKTAWKVGHAIRALMKAHGDAIGPLDGIVELDEKYLGGKPRFERGVIHQRGKGTSKSCIHVAVKRQGAAKAQVVPGDSYSDLALRVAAVVSPDARVMTDQLRTYKAIGKEYAAHESVNHGNKEFSRDGVHVNTAESFNAILERAKQGVFHYLSKRHLTRYVGEVAFRWNNRDPVKEIIKNGVSKIVMQAKPVLEQLRNLLSCAVGIQLRRTIYYGIATPQPSFGG